MNTDRPTYREELAARLRVHRKVYGNRVESYNATLGIGRVKKAQDRPFCGMSISGINWKDQ